MTISITALHVDVSDQIRNYAEEKFTKVANTYRVVQTVEVILKNEDRQMHCEVIIHTRNRNAVVIDVGRDELNEAIDKAVDKCDRQLRRLKEKRQSQRRKAINRADLHAASLPEESQG